MFSTIDHFQMFKPDSVNCGHMALQIKAREPIKGIREVQQCATPKEKVKLTSGQLIPLFPQHI